MIKTTPKQREEMYYQHQAGKTYAEVAEQNGLSQGCVRYWCRRQRGGGSVVTVYPTRRMLAGFDPKVPYCILRLRLEHPRWGPGRICYHLSRRGSLKGLALPSRAQVGRYLHQWPRFRRQPKQQAASPQRGCATRIHQRWQIDFKVQIPLADGEGQLFTAMDEVSGACLGGRMFATPGSRPKLAEVVAFLRYCFTRWGCLPEEIQTDGEAILIGRPGEHYFPSRFSLWLVGLGITHFVIPSRQPTENAEVERGQRTLNEYVLIRREKLAFEQVNPLLEQGVQELVYQLPSQGKDCQGRPPVVAYPALLDPHRPYHPDQEREIFSLERVDAFLVQKSWLRLVGKTGLITIGEQRTYSVGRKYAGKQILVRFDPHDRNFVCFSMDERTKEPIAEIGRRPARGLEIADLMMQPHTPLASIQLQLPLQWVWPVGVNVDEQVGV